MSRFARKLASPALAVAAALALTSAAPVLAADEPAGQNAQGQPEKHHSKLKGAAVGGVGGAVVGGKKGAAVGAAGGALYQHHKNKKAAKRAEKAQTQGTTAQ